MPDVNQQVREVLERLIADGLELGAQVAAYLDGTERDPAFFENMAVGFRVEDPARSYHVPLLLTPFGLSTYRGS